MYLSHLVIATCASQMHRHNVFNAGIVVVSGNRMVE